MTLADLDVEELARHIAVRLDPEALLDAEDAAAMLKAKPRHFTDTLSKAPGFPKPIRLPLPGGGHGMPRWRRSAIAAYIAMQEDLQRPASVTRPGAQGGRPRKRV